MHSSHEFRSLKAKIRVLCKQRWIRLEEFMKTFDVHHDKKIKAEQFKRALDVSGLHLSSAEVNLLLAKYRFPDEPLFVDYRRFCDLIDKVFTVKGLEGNPELKNRIRNEMPSLKKFGAASLSESELELLKLVKAKLFAAVMNKGIVLKDVFHDFDQSNAGKVTKPQFVRGLLDIMYLTKEEMDVLLKAYGDELDVHYRALHFDICPGAAGAGTTVAAPRSPDRRRYTAPAAFEPGSTDADAVQELEAELSELVFRNRIRTKNFFTDFDSLRTGKCSEAQFKRCVKLCFGSLTESDLDLLVKKYVIKGLDCNKVDYIRFCNYVEGKSNCESNDDSNNYDDILSSIAASTITSSATKCSREARGTLSDVEAEIHQTPSFQDFDKGRREHITIEQFFRVMTILKLTLANDAEKRVLLKHYASTHGDRSVNYVTFCYDLEHWKSGTTNQSRPLSRGNIVSEIISPTRIKPCTFEEVESEIHTRSVPMLLRYIKQIAKRDRIRLDEYYRDFDKLRRGNVTATQFCAGLRTAELILSKDEMKLLGDECACRELVDSAGQHFVAWKRFVDDVESVFTVKGLERVPNHDLSALVTRGGRFGGVKEEKELTNDEERRVTQVAVTMKRAIDRQRLSIKPTFEDFDRTKQGFISATKFERVLSMFSLLPADGAQTRLLVLKFREPIANGTTNTTLSSIRDVNYRAFLQTLGIIGITPKAEGSTLLLPGSVAYRQELFNAGAIKPENAAAIRQMRNLDTSSLTDVSLLIAKIRRQLNVRRIRIKEFVTEGGKLWSGEITVAKFHTALNRSGCVLDAADVDTLSTHFLSAKNSDKIDWRAFLDAIEQVGQSPDMNGELKGIASSTDKNDDSMHRILARVTKFQYAAVLDMMKLELAPHEVQALCDRFAVRDGRKVTNDVNYLAFIHAVDSDYS
ncbi:hypothetical protein FI667_g17277, partial [Globisporangium splendens]